MNKAVRIILVVIAALGAVLFVSWRLRFDRGEPTWGVTWSEFRAREELRLPDWRAAYRAVLEELKPRKVQLVAYWQYLEPEEGRFNFEDLGWQVREAERRGVEITLIVGKRVPRWPECHLPAWTAGLSASEFEQKLFRYLGAFIERYRFSPAVKVWQVENEPLLTLFGNCARISRDLLKREIALVRSLDPVRPVMVTDSGELSFWMRTAGLSDILGTTLYRVVWNEFFGWWKHLYPPAWYALRAALVKAFTRTQEVIVSELQAEPWPRGGGSIIALPLDEQTERFGPEAFRENVDFARRTGLKEAYLWGAEWWYWRKVNGDPSFWDAARELLNKK